MDHTTPPPWLPPLIFWIVLSSIIIKIFSKTSSTPLAAYVQTAGWDMGCITASSRGFSFFFFFSPGHIFQTAACDSRCIPQSRSQRRLPNEPSMEKLVRRWDLRWYGRMNEWTDWNEYEKNKNYVPWLSLFRQVIRSMRAGSHAIWLSRIKKQSCARWWHR